MNNPIPHILIILILILLCWCVDISAIKTEDNSVIETGGLDVSVPIKKPKFIKIK